MFGLTQEGEGGKPTDGLSSGIVAEKSVMYYFEKICLVSGFSLTTSIKSSTSTMVQTAISCRM